jgi:Circadian oscillating protein COP23
MTRPFIHLGIIFSSAIIAALPSLPVASQPTAPTEVTFFCRETFDPASNKKIPITYAWVPERNGNIAIIGWKSEFFSKYNMSPSDRCKEATEKFQTAYQNQQLNYLSAGTINGYPVVCGVAAPNGLCTSANKLFTLKPHDRPNDVLRQLVDVLEGKTSDMLQQSSSDQIYLPIKKLLKEGSLAQDRDAPCRQKGGGTAAKPCTPQPTTR